MSTRRRKDLQRGKAVSTAPTTATQTQPRPSGSSTRKLLLLFGGAVLGLLLCEVLLRVCVCFRAGSARPLIATTIVSTGIERSDPFRNHALVEGVRFIATGNPPGFEFCNYGQISQQGLNDEPLPLPKAPGEIRVLVLGDSFVEARQVKRCENFCQVLQQGLARQQQRPIRVINAGVSSYSPLLCYLYFIRDLAPYRPDIVVFAFFANDVFDDMRYTQVASFDAQGAPAAVSTDAPWPVFPRAGDTEQSMRGQQQMLDALAPPPSWWSHHFYTAALAQRVLASYQLRKAFAEPPRNDEFFILEDNPELAPIQQQGWQLTQRYIALLKTACENTGARFVLTSVPIASQVTGHSSYDHFFFQGRPTEANEVNLKRMASELNVPFADLLSPLRQAGDGLYFAQDGHWTPKGHRVAAAALQKTLSPMLAK